MLATRCKILEYWSELFEKFGSLGITAQNRPFLSFTTDSDDIADAYIELIYKITGKRLLVSRNQRDNVYNILVFDKTAQKLANYLYEESDINISRKYKNYQDIMKWKRPSWRP